MKSLNPIKTLSWSLNLDDLACYAWVSGDINPIHYDAEAAIALGLPGPIVHGLFAQSKIAAEIQKLSLERGLGSLKSTETKFMGMMTCPGTYQIRIFEPSQGTQIVGHILNKNEDLCVEVIATMAT
jgi:hypothetical protein